MAERQERKRAARKTPVPPSQKDRSRKAPGRPPEERYVPRTYLHAVRYGCKKAGVAPWHPPQLRHSAATRLRKEYGIEVARVVLGHASALTTEIYAEADRQKAIAVMGQVG